MWLFNRGTQQRQFHTTGEHTSNNWQITEKQPNKITNINRGDYLHYWMLVCAHTHLCGNHPHLLPCPGYLLDTFQGSSCKKQVETQQLGALRNRCPARTPPGMTQPKWVLRAIGVLEGTYSWPWCMFLLNTSAPKSTSILPGSPKPGPVNCSPLSCFHPQLYGIGWVGRLVVTICNTTALTCIDLPFLEMLVTLKHTIPQEVGSTLFPPIPLMLKACLLYC